ncbi:hypothetical protein BCR36DRAFT_280255 [Piromyces finnis]|uniref:Uncharacterized protein n=1 Tax=Piromyces finnis TaxID=1754191 RepID=A0A1Y1VHW3_9FUNG|nr:hypothetical protein BCR36DRAFT_280255 [Piromyces finnis]|eukprot:ORX56632.1 hypothetical protein BCR36DRAFT_280255 [Piromyces finnis]
MIPNNTIYEAGFKSQFFTIVLISSSLIFSIWTFTRLIIKFSQNEENQKQLNILYQKCLDILNYYLDDFKFIEEAIKYFQKNYRHKQVNESIAVEDGLLKPCTKKDTIYCDEYFEKVVQKHKSEKNKYSDVSIYLTLTNGVTLNYIPKYPWYWDGVELFMGIQPNIKQVYNYNFLSPDYVPSLNIVKPNDSNKNLVYETKNVETEKEAQTKNQYSLTLTEPTDEEKKLSTLLLTKNNTINTISISSIPVVNTIISNNENNEIENVSVPIETKETKNMTNDIIIIPQNYKIESNSISLDLKNSLKHSKSISYISKEDQSVSIRKSKSLPNLNEEKKSSSKQLQKQKFLKKLKHKKQPKIIYPSIPVNPDLSFVPLYMKDLNESKIERRVKHSDMENTYKKLKFEVQRKLK